MTSTAPVSSGGRMVGVVGADSLLETLEELFLPSLRAAGATLVNDQGRAVMSADPHVAMRSLISFRIAILDVWALCAATFALGAAFIWRGLEDGVSAGSLITLNRPILGIVTLVLLSSAALGSWQGLPLSVVIP